MNFNDRRTHRVRQKAKGATREQPSSNYFYQLFRNCRLGLGRRLGRLYLSTVEFKFMYSSTRHRPFLDAAL